MTIKDTDIRDYARQRIKIAKEELKKWRLVLEALGEDITESTQLSLISQESKDSFSLKPNQSKPRILDKIVGVLKEVNCPLTSRDIMEAINTMYPERVYTMDSFSGAFSAAYRKPKSGIHQYEMKNPSFRVKVLYGLNKWFNENGEFKDEYREKVLSRYGNI